MPRVLDGYRRDGFALLPGAFASEAAAWRAEAERLAALPAVRDPRNLRNGLSWRGGIGPPERIDPVVDLSPRFASLLRDPRLVALIDALEPGAQLVKDKLLLKPPGMDGYAIHQDGAWWQWPGVNVARCFSIALALDAATRENGAIEVFAGRHDRLLSTEGERRDMTRAEAEAADLRDATLVAMAPGDALVFHALTPHRSAPNRADAPRRMLYLTFLGGAAPGAYARFQESYRAMSLEHVPAPERARYALR